jgi:ATP-dependent DNA ligase
MPAGKVEKRVLRAPCFVPPLLPTLVETPPASEGWLHEIKHDGYRTQLVIDRGKARAFSRNGHDWTDKYPRVAGDAKERRLLTRAFLAPLLVRG